MDVSVDNQELNIALKRALFDESFSPWFIGILSTLVCTAFLYGRVPEFGLSLWAAASLIVSMLRLPILIRAKQQADADLPATHFTILIGMSGVLWGSLALFWAPDADIVDQIIIVLAPLLLSLGGVSSHTHWRATYLTFVVSIQITLMLILFTTGGDGIARIFGPLVFFLFASVFMGNRLHKQNKETLTLRLRNQRLLDDVSQQNDSLILARDEAQKACQIKDEFLARMSHELRTPMNGVLGLSQLLSKTALDQQQNELMTTLQQSGEGMLSLIDNLLDASSLVIGEIDLNNQSYNIAQVLDSIEAQSALPLSKKDIKLSVEIAPDVPRGIIGDERRVKQVLSALVDNAIKFTHCGSVNVRVECADNPDTLSDEHENREHLLIAVSDTGIGIPHSELHQVREMFYQSDGHASRRFSGSGLGLPVANGLVDLMGGSLSISSEVDKGTCINVYIPLLIDPALDEAADLNQTADACEFNEITGRKQVLLAEDNPINQLVIETMLEDLNCDVTVAENGLDALAELENGEFDIVLMDCQMPELDGYSATTRARELGYQLPIVAVTANAMAGDREKCLSVGMNDYVSKPFTEDTIARMLEKWTSKGGLEHAV